VVCPRQQCQEVVCIGDQRQLRKVHCAIRQIKTCRRHKGPVLIATPCNQGTLIIETRKHQCIGLSASTTNSTQILPINRAVLVRRTIYSGTCSGIRRGCRGRQGGRLGSGRRTCRRHRRRVRRRINCRSNCRARCWFYRGFHCRLRCWHYSWLRSRLWSRRCRWFNSWGCCGFCRRGSRRIRCWGNRWINGW
jgi:hypothetical protein